MIGRVLAPTALLLAAFAAQPVGGHAAGATADTRVLRSAAARLAHTRPVAVVRWLRSRPTVRSAAVGRDGTTVDVHFVDGREMLVLPSESRGVRLGGVPVSPRIRMHPHQAAGSRAAVLEPFATELGLTSDAAAPVAQALQHAGFAVDTAVDAQVSVSSLLSLSQYSVVYMHTHSGVSAQGAGVVASGEVANGDPAVAPLLADGSVIVVGVAGSNQQFYGVTARFIEQHIGALRPGSLFFINGCALLKTADFWSALQTEGAGVLVSWNADATNSDNYLTGAAFFNVMQGQGTTVSGTISILQSAGYGTSTYNGVRATLGYQGNGAVTLVSAASAGPSATSTPTPPPFPTSTRVPTPTTTPEPTRRPTSTPLPTSTPIPRPTNTRTATPIPSATPTATPVPVVLSGLPAVANAGTALAFDVHSSPGASVVVRLTFPDGDVVNSTAAAGSDGVAHISSPLKSSRITRHSRTVTVSVSALGTTASGSFTIGFGKIDVSIEPRIVSRGATTVIWVHSARVQKVKIKVTPKLTKADVKTATTGKNGWAKVYYVVSKARALTTTLTVHARTVGGNVAGSTSQTFTIQ